jgi:signal recognition particle receptor subunit beta
LTIRTNNPQIPKHVVANKQNLANAKSPTEIVKWLHVTPAHGLSGITDRSSCIQVTLDLLKQIKKKKINETLD